MNMRAALFPFAFTFVTPSLICAYGYANPMMGGGMYPQQRMGLMGTLAAHNTIDNIEDFKKEQASKLANLEFNIKDFKLWLGKEGILDYYQRVLTAYNANVDVEEKYRAYLSKKPTNGVPLTPAGYRLLQYRYTFMPLSEVLDKLEKIQDTLDEHKPGIDAIKNPLGSKKRISELRDDSRDYNAEYIHPNKAIEQPATPDVIQRASVAGATIDGYESQLTAVRTGLQNYLYKMGISDTGLRENPNDMKDMAQDCEGLLKKITADPLSGALQQQTFKQYTTTIDPKDNPLIVPLTSNFTFLGCSPDTLTEKLEEYRTLLLQTDKEIRKKAVPSKSMADELTPLDTKVYFTDNSIPPDIQSLQTSADVEHYMFDGYLGYWLQSIANRLIELNICGASIITQRLSLREAALDLKSKYLSPPLALFPGMKDVPIITNPAADTMSLSQLKAVLKDGITDNSLPSLQGMLAEYAKTMEATGTWTKTTGGRLKQYPTALLTLSPEGIELRKTLLLLSLLKALCDNTEFGPHTYTQDVFGPVPASLFPALSDKEAA